MDAVKDARSQTIVSVPVTPAQLEWINEQAEREMQPGYTKPNRSVVVRRLIELEMQKERGSK